MWRGWSVKGGNVARVECKGGNVTRVEYKGGNVARVECRGGMQHCRNVYVAPTDC
jgi:hypothetical protein